MITAVLPASNLIEHDDLTSDFAQEWESHLAALTPGSPLDRKARDMALAWSRAQVDGGRAPAMSRICEALGMRRETAANRMLRAASLGWLIVGDSPLQARGATVPRVYLRKCFWSDDPWNGAYGDNSPRF